MADSPNALGPITGDSFQHYFNKGRCSGHAQFNADKKSVAAILAAPDASGGNL